MRHCGNYILNDLGGVTWVPEQRVGEPEARSDILADVRALADATHELCAAHHESWPLPYPKPERIHCALLAADYGLMRVRSGMLRRLAQLDTGVVASHMREYVVDTADLIHIQDAINELVASLQFHVDQLDVQARVKTTAMRLRSIVENAGRQYVGRVDGIADEVVRVATGVRG